MRMLKLRWIPPQDRRVSRVGEEEGEGQGDDQEAELVPPPTPDMIWKSPIQYDVAEYESSLRVGHSCFGGTQPRGCLLCNLGLMEVTSYLRCHRSLLWSLYSPSQFPLLSWTMRLLKKVSCSHKSHPYRTYLDMPSLWSKCYVHISLQINFHFTARLNLEPWQIWAWQQ